MAQERNLLLEVEDPAAVTDPSFGAELEERKKVEPDSPVGEAAFDASAIEMDWFREPEVRHPTNIMPDNQPDFDIPDRSEALTLRQSLMSQLESMVLDPMEKLVCDHIVADVNDAGYMEIGLDVLQQEILAQEGMLLNDAGLSSADMEHCLKLVQSLEPTGVGARSPKECLQIQLRALDPHLPGHEIANLIVQDHLSTLAERDYQVLKRKLRIDEDTLRIAIDLIRSLSPHPGYSVGDVSLNYIVPDVAVEFTKGVWLARLNTRSLPKIGINRDYHELIKKNASDTSFSQMKEQLQDAKSLLLCVEKRHNTILSVASQIVERQQEFFHHGPSAMQPLGLRDIAEALDIHESTVSRAVNGKYMMTPLGVLEFKYFFSAQLGAEGGSKSSATAIRTLIKDMIDAEDARKPISDQKICEELGRRGYELARRTVSKYREQLHIPGSSKRKTY